VGCGERRSRRRVELPSQGELAMKWCYVTVAAVLAAGFAATAIGQEAGQGEGAEEESSSVRIVNLLAIDEVRKELNISGDQKQRLDALREILGDPRNLVPLERRRRYDEYTQKVEETAKTVLDEKQQQRLGELLIQRAGASALSRAEIADKLGLDQSQRDKIRKIQGDNFRNALSDIKKKPSEEELKKFVAGLGALKEKWNAELLAVLTPKQKQSFDKLQGAKFNFPPPKRRPSGKK